MAKSQTRQKLGIVAQPQEAIIQDYQIAYMSRVASLIGRKEVLTGKAKFGIFGDGKEVAQVALARSFRKGDWRAGCYRDQTFMLAIGAYDIKKFFAQLFADSNLAHEPASGGRQMNNHFASRYLDQDGNWLNQCLMHNTSADLSPTGAQMGRLLGLAYASKLYRNDKELSKDSKFSISGNEVAFGMIGNASTSEGVFWESINAAGVLQVPMALVIWDDEYGISVPNSYQTTKASLSAVLEGFRYDAKQGGIDLYRVKGWDYEDLCKTFQTGIDRVRKNHIPAIFHVVEMTQPQGHSTSGSHERYKSKERLAYEDGIDCVRKMRLWMESTGIASAKSLDKLEETCKAEVEALRAQAWSDYMSPIEEERREVLALYEEAKGSGDSEASEILDKAILDLRRAPTLFRRTIHTSLQRTVIRLRKQSQDVQSPLKNYLSSYAERNQQRYSSHLLSETNRSPLKVQPVAPVFADPPERIDGRQIVQRFFDLTLERDPRVFVVGEDIGKLGGVNLEFEGLNEKHGELRVTDTGIREATILGQGLGAAMRGLRPIVDIQYLDYLLYCFQLLSDDLATLHYRTAGGQIAPVIVRTKGHRLEGIWHTGSPLGTVINGIRGVHVCVPRDMTQAVGMYNTLLQGDDPALVIEVLNGYRIKESCPANLSEFSVPLGVPEILRQGSDITIVTYGACIRIVQEAMELLSEIPVDVELVDVQTLLPFDREKIILQSIKKTGAVLFVDEDVPGGASAFMMQQVLEGQGAYEFLDATPKTLAAKPHRSAYASDGDYYSKPNAEDVFHAVVEILGERDPGRFADLG